MLDGDDPASPVIPCDVFDVADVPWVQRHIDSEILHLGGQLCDNDLLIPVA